MPVVEAAPLTGEYRCDHPFSFAPTGDPETDADHWWTLSTEYCPDCKREIAQSEFDAVGPSLRWRYAEDCVAMDAIYES